MGGGDGAAASGEDNPIAPHSLVLEVVGEYMKVPTEPAEVTVMARLKALPSQAEEEGEEGGGARAPITLCAAIDRSGSMKDHLPLLKETLCFMVQQLTAKDKLCLITFDDKVQVELPLTAMTPDGKLRAEQAIHKVKERGQTNLSGGLLAALEVLYHIKADDASLVESVLLFTDGKANVGIRDQRTIVKATKSLLGQINRQACVFTFGYGSEHDANMLKSVAEAGSGLFYYLDNSDSIPESFCDCLGGLLSVAAQNVKLTMTASAEATLCRPLTSYSVTEKQARQCYQVSIHDIYCEEERCILATASLCRNNNITEPTSVAVVTCKVEYFDVLTNRQSEAEVTFTIVRNQRLDRPIPSDSQDDIELQRVRCEVAETLKQAGSLADAGNIPAARHMLVEIEGKVKKRVMIAKPVGQPLAQHLHRTVQHSLDGLEDTITYKKHGRSTLANYAQSHSEQRSSATPSLDGYQRASQPRSAGGAEPPPPPPPPPYQEAVLSPYRVTGKKKMMAKYPKPASK